MTRQNKLIARRRHDHRNTYLDSREIGEAAKMLRRIWRASKTVLAKDGIELPEATMVLDNVDSLEQAAHVELGEGLTLICRSRLADCDDLSKGFIAELVVWEKTGTIFDVSKIAISCELKTERWVFFVNSSPGRSKKITALLHHLGISNPLARVSRDIEERVAVGLMSAIVKWTVQHIHEHRRR